MQHTLDEMPVIFESGHHFDDGVDGKDIRHDAGGACKGFVLFYFFI